MGRLVSPDVPAHSREDKAMKEKYSFDWLFNTSIPTSLKEGWTIEEIMEKAQKEDAEDYANKSLNFITRSIFGGGSVARHNPEELDRYNYPDGFISAREQNYKSIS